MLELINVTKKYIDDKGENITALDDVSLSLSETGLVVINGTSGCGKTTLLNILGGLDRPTSGEVRLNDARIDDEDEKWWDLFRGSSLGFVYQDFNLLDHMTVKQNVQLPLELLNIEEEERKSRIDKIMDELGLSEYMNKKAGKLSGGQKQRVAIARALVTDSKIILADEPTGNLDRENSENVFRLLKEVAKNRLVIVVTHDSTLASAYADRLIHINYGKIASDTDKNDNNEREVGKIANITNNDAALKEHLTSKSNQRRLSLKEAFLFAKEAMRQRKTRCAVSVMIFSITTLFILVLCEAVFRDDSVPIANYINDHNQKILPLYIQVPDEYSNIASDDEITTGRKLYDIISSSTDKSQIIRLTGTHVIQLENGNYKRANKAFVSAENEKYFTYEGKYPERKNEIAVSKILADSMGNAKDVLNSELVIEEKKYIITAIVSKICDTDISELYVEDGVHTNWLDDNIIFYTVDDLVDRNSESEIYMSGFGVTKFTNLFYQTTVYNDICVADNQIKLVSGSMPQNDNEILISQYLLDLRGKTDKDVLGKEYKLIDIYDEQYGCAYWNMLNLYDYIGESVKVVGIADTSGEYYITPSLFDKMFDQVETYYEESYYLIVDDEKLEDDIRSLLASEVKIRDIHLGKVYELMMNIDLVKIIMLIAAMVIALLAVLQMISLYSYSINDNKKTIGVLRTLGVTKTDTKKIFTVECIVISVISFIFAIVMGIITTSVLNEFLCQSIFEFNGFDFLHMRVVVVLAVGFINVALSVLSVLIPLKKYSKMKVIELIK